MVRTARSVAVLAVAAFALTACGSEDAPAGSAALDPQVIKAGALTVCADMPYEPFESLKAGKPVGFDVDLVDEIAKRLKVKPVIQDTDFDAIQSGESLNSGDCDVAISAMTITGERARVLDFSSPYFDASQAMVVDKGESMTSLADAAGKKIGVQGGTTGELYVTDNAPSDAEIVPLEDQSAMEAALKSGDVDAAVYDNTVVGDVISRNPSFEMVAEFDTGEQYGMAVRKNGSVDLLRTINDVLADLKSDGGYDTIYTKWFGSTS
ncbi:putative amino acid ABC transporter, substrate-binding protein [metagenome]|uniref:Putative amino acid ABC transporter, substrate-binding protein n=1 Tax=metagenome TaxID=256318 RepID=A0A2P2CEL4_9ZZZZ